MKTLFRNPQSGDCSTGQIVIAQKLVFLANFQIRCLVFGSRVGSWLRLRFEEGLSFDSK
jgi:hypothetical protein